MQIFRVFSQLHSKHLEILEMFDFIHWISNHGIVNFLATTHHVLHFGNNAYIIHVRVLYVTPKTAQIDNTILTDGGDGCVCVCVWNLKRQQKAMKQQLQRCWWRLWVSRHQQQTVAHQLSQMTKPPSPTHGHRQVSLTSWLGFIVDSQGTSEDVYTNMTLK